MCDTTLSMRKILCTIRFRYVVLFVLDCIGSVSPFQRVSVTGNFIQDSRLSSVVSFPFYRPPSPLSFVFLNTRATRIVLTPGSFSNYTDLVF